MYTVRWTQRGAIREVKADLETAARVVADALCALYKGQDESVQVWVGMKTLVDRRS